MIYLAADHRGFALKEAIIKRLSGRGVETTDAGNVIRDPEDDYVDFAARVAEKVSENPAENRGIVICGSGHGMDMVVNKFPGARAALCWNADVAQQSREHEDANVLVLPSDWVSEDDAVAVVDTWLDTPFSGEERHLRRLKKMSFLDDAESRPTFLTPAHSHDHTPSSKPKNFNQWNSDKKVLHEKKERPFYHIREVWFAHIGINIGFEQDGVRRESLRPVVILRKFNNDICWVAPLTRSKKRGPYYFPISPDADAESVLILSQVRLIDAKRLKYKTGYMSRRIFDEAKHRIRDLMS